MQTINIRSPYKKPSLFNMEFVLIGDLERPKNEIEEMIKKSGGKLVTKIHSSIAAVISTKLEVEAMGSEISPCCFCWKRKLDVSL